MSDTVNEEIFIGKDNVISLIMLEDDIAKDLTSVTEIAVSFAGYSASSSNNAVYPIKWAGGLATGEAVFQLGSIPNLRKGEYLATITITDPDNTNGLIWIDNKSDVKLLLEVR